MSVYFAPSSFHPREFGYIQGVVLDASPFAVSTASIEAELKNPDLARAIGGKNVQMRIVVELLADRKAPSGYKWTSKNGAPSPLEAGTFGSLLINAEQRAPVSYIIPYIRHSVLGVGKKHDNEQERKASAKGSEG